MFKYLKVVIIAVFFVLVSVGLSMASSGTDIVKKYTIENATGSDIKTYIATTIIVPNQTKILGFSVNPHSTGVSQGALWDEASTTAHHTDNMFGEVSSPASLGGSYSFPYPKVVSTQLCATLTKNSVMIIYYTK
jgi:hypothetical protein